MDLEVRVGAKFESFKDFKAAIEVLQEKENVIFTTKDSMKIKTDPNLYERFQYHRLLLECKQGTVRKAEGSGQRKNQRNNILWDWHNMAAELVQNVVEIMDSAHNYRYELAEVLEGIQNLQNQINSSSDAAKEQVQAHFTNLRKALLESLDTRLAQLQDEIEIIRKSALQPLDECKSLVEESLKSAAQVMEEGTAILGDNPEDNSEKILKFKENPKTKSLSSVPAIPSPAEVACVNVVLAADLHRQLSSIINAEGRVLAQAPVQITDVVEKPGSLLVQWAEIDDDHETFEFWLQYASGSHKDLDSTAVFHTAYVGTSMCYLVKHLRTATPYTFRVCGRGESDTPWSAWSIPKVASTTMEHYQWGPSENNAYTFSNERKTATRTGEGVTHVLYSSKPSLHPGNMLTIKVLDDADKSPGDGLCLALSNTSTDTIGQDGVVYVNAYGSVFVDGQEMTMKLPEIKKGSIVAFQTELLPNGKVRVSIETDDKEVTFDWKVDIPPGSMVSGMMGGDAAGKVSIYFGIKFSQEDWKIAVD